MKKVDTNLLPKLMDLGLTKQEGLVYFALLKEGSLPAKEIAQRINILPHAVYRTAKKLEAKKLVGILKTSPLTFQVLSPQLAFPAFVKESAINLEKTAEELAKLLTQKKTTPKPTKIELIYGKHNLYMVNAKEMDDLKEEFLVISIGEHIPQELLLAAKRAHDRGVVLRMIAHKYDEENKEILENFKKNGYNIRHYPDWGFHLVVYDGKKALLMINNPEDTDERVGMNICSEGFSKALRDYFYSVWEKAIEI